MKLERGHFNNMISVLKGMKRKMFHVRIRIGLTFWMQGWSKDRVGVDMEFVSTFASTSASR